jgi:GntR family transcriptional regulator, rspAB operon transcriptional repressor
MVKKNKFQEERIGMLDVSPIDRPQSLKDLAYTKIRASLVRGQMDPDSVYSAAQFAETLGVSRTPIREALLQLVAEGFLVVVEQKGFRLRRFTEKEIREIFETRRLIETYAAEKLTGTLTDEDVRGLKATIKQMASLAADGDTAGFLEADRAFHMSIINRLDNRMLATIMETIRGQVTLFALKAIAYPGRSTEILREHGEILETLRGKDPKKSVRAVVDHLETTEKYVLGGRPKS